MPGIRALIQMVLMFAVLPTVMLSVLSCSSDGSRGAGDEVSPPDDVTPRRVLIITGEDYPGHDWRTTTPVLEALLEYDQRLEVEVLDDLPSLGSTDLSPYAAAVLHFKNYDPQIPGRAGFDNLARFVDGGGGLVLVHFACGAFEEFRADYEKLVGRVWFGAEPPPGEYQHDPHGRFTVNIVDDDHPVTRGIRSFETIDELYTCLTGDTPIKMLASASSMRDGTTHPIAFVPDDHSRRVFHCVLGHDPDAIQIGPVAELYRRATAWAAGFSPIAPTMDARAPSRTSGREPSASRRPPGVAFQPRRPRNAP